MDDPLADEKYISLATFRKTGKSVETPIWFAHAGGSYFAFSANSAGKAPPPVLLHDRLVAQR